MPDVKCNNKLSSCIAGWLWADTIRQLFCGRCLLCGLLQADAMKSVIGFPQYILNASKLDDRYKEVPRSVISTFFAFLFYAWSAVVSRGQSNLTKGHIVAAKPNRKIFSWDSSSCWFTCTNLRLKSVPFFRGEAIDDGRTRSRSRWLLSAFGSCLICSQGSVAITGMRSRSVGRTDACGRGNWHGELSYINGPVPVY